MNSPRPLALIVERAPFAPPVGGPQLALALREDLREMVSAMRLRAGPDAPANADALAAQAEQGLVLLFADVAALPPMALEAALEAVNDADLALGPCPDGSLYLLALRPGLEPELARDLLRCALEPGGLTDLTDLCDEADLSAVVLPPWFRLASGNELSFAECLARLSLMTEEGEDDFVADRLRLWFEQHAEP